MRIPVVLLTLVTIVSTGCRPAAAPVDLEAEREAVMQADREFASATAERGVEGWVSYFADDGLMLPDTGEIVRGHDSIRELMRPAFESPGFTISWTPEFAEVSAGGDLAYTHGSYETGARDAEGNEVVTRGRYVTIWRKLDDGSWKVVLDIGNSEPGGQE